MRGKRRHRATGPFRVMEIHAVTSPQDDQPNQALPHQTPPEPDAPPALGNRPQWQSNRRAAYLLLGSALIASLGTLLVAHTTEPVPPRPQFSKFVSGTVTSGFDTRSRVQHFGIDIAGPTGTPILAVADGTVLEAGPASGMGMWVRLLHNDGTVTVYGHINSATVSAGQRVSAGDQIATLGNTGFSTGPHCHFEVWLHDKDKTDPLPWLAARGISLGP